MQLTFAEVAALHLGAPLQPSSIQNDTLLMVCEVIASGEAL